MRLIDGDALLEELPVHPDGGMRSVKNACLMMRVRETVKNAPTVNGWVSVKDRLPEEKENPYTKDYQEVICVLKTRFGSDVRVYKFGEGHFWNGPTEIDRYITHWMPFPEMPEEGEPE